MLFQNKFEEERGKKNILVHIPRSVQISNIDMGAPCFSCNVIYFQICHKRDDILTRHIAEAIAFVQAEKESIMLEKQENGIKIMPICQK